MSFSADFITSTTLIKIELPTGTLFFSDAGFVTSGADTYVSEDPVFGTLSSGESISDGQGDEVPAASITFLANENATVAQLTDPGIQLSKVTISQATVDPNTGIVITNIPLFSGVVDVPTLEDGDGGRSVKMTLVSDTERFFMVNEGNRMTQENHQRRWAGELGLNNMTSIERAVAWGTISKPRGAGGSTGGSGGTGVGGNGSNFGLGFQSR